MLDTILFRMFTPHADGLRKLALASSLHTEIQRYISGVGCYKHRRSTFTLLLEQLESLQDDATAPPTPNIPDEIRPTDTVGVRPVLEGAGQAVSRVREALGDGASYVAVKGGII